MIGVDKDQASDSPRVFNFSDKRCSFCYCFSIGSFYQSNFDVGGQILNLGAVDDGVGLPLGESWRFSSFTIEEYQSLYDKLVDGTINVPSTYETLKTYVEGLGYTLNLSFEDIGM